MSRIPRSTIRKFNPGVFQSDREVIKQFVVRHRELNTVLEIIRGNVSAPSCQHTLVVGPRGCGKTMLLARVAAELRTDPHLREALVPVRYMEESLEIFDIGDFWLEALFHLAKECAHHHQDLSGELERTRVELAQKARSEDIAGRARASVLDAADRLGARLVLMVENLQDLCGDVDEDFGWQLRESLQSDPGIILLASATSRFEALEDAGEPFFELFRVLQLNPLNTAECRCLWQAVSGEHRQDRQIRPLEIFTGGSPRLLVILGEFGRHRSTPQLIEEMVGLIDDHTEYFRGHLDALPKTERRVFLAAADLWRPSRTRDIAKRARLGVREVSALLGRLVKRGAVRIEGSGRNRLYAVSERLYCIYYKLRHQRDDAAVVRGVIRFMVAFYEPEEAAPMLGALLADRAFDAAFPGGGGDIGLGRIASGMAAATHRQLRKRYRGLGERDRRIRVAGELMDNASGFGRSGQLARSIEYSDEVIRSFDSIPDPGVRSTVARAFVNRGVAMQQSGQHRAALGAFTEVVTRFGDLRTPEVQECMGTALLAKGFLHGRLEEPEQAIAAYDEAVDRFGDSQLPQLRLCVANCLRNKGSMLAEASPDAARAAWDAVVERFIDDDLPEIQLQVSSTMIKQAGAAIVGRKGELAIAACDAVEDRYGNSENAEVLRQVALALELKGMAQNQLGLPGDALATCELLIRRFGAMEGYLGLPVGWRAMGIKGMALVQQGDELAALDILRMLCSQLDIDNPAMLQKLVWDTIDVVAGGASPGPVADVLVQSAERSEFLVPLVAALRRLSGHPMPVAEEVSQVADDVIEQIRARAPYVHSN